MQARSNASGLSSSGGARWSDIVKQKGVPDQAEIKVATDLEQRRYPRVFKGVGTSITNVATKMKKVGDEHREKYSENRTSLDVLFQQCRQHLPLTKSDGKISIPFAANIGHLRFKSNKTGAARAKLFDKGSRSIWQKDLTKNGIAKPDITSKGSGAKKDAIVIDSSSDEEAEDESGLQRLSEAQADLQESQMHLPLVVAIVLRVAMQKKIYEVASAELNHAQELTLDLAEGRLREWSKLVPEAPPDFFPNICSHIGLHDWLSNDAQDDDDHQIPMLSCINKEAVKSALKDNDYLRVWNMLSNRTLRQYGHLLKFVHAHITSYLSCR
jgi:hypothetical protein